MITKLSLIGKVIPSPAVEGDGAFIATNAMKPAAGQAAPSSSTRYILLPCKVVTAPLFTTAAGIGLIEPVGAVSINE